MTARGVHTCCPAAPSTINVTVNTIELDGDTAVFINETYTGSDVSSNVLTLAHTPYSSAAVQVIYNSGTLRPFIDYEVSANKIVFLFTPDASAKIHIRSLKVGANISTLTGSELGTGTLIGWGGSASDPTWPDGWLKMDGSTTVTAASYSALHAFLGTHLDLVEETVVSATYTLKEINSSYFDEDGTLLTGIMLIKT